ncbi:hypothetical protein EV128_106142 [Rhizobium azibense]|nr:hypothetical protein EV128_106142 [Rhizobium azibense]
MTQAVGIADEGSVRRLLASRRSPGQRRRGRFAQACIGSLAFFRDPANRHGSRASDGPLFDEEPKTTLVAPYCDIAT